MGGENEGQHHEVEAKDFRQIVLYASTWENYYLPMAASYHERTANG